MLGEKSVLVGMSGGIDSTAVCCMLLSEGYRVEGLTFVTCDAGLAAAEKAAALAKSLGIRHHIADVREEFRATVVKEFINSYLAGRTPNPCVVLSINETDIAVVKQITPATSTEELEKMAASMEETLKNELRRRSLP